jgi:NTP pyrophosphatase (non-canonical NTP hydrolase)
MIDKLLKFQKIHGIWSDKTFGSTRSPKVPLFHLKKEVEEVLSAPTDPEEYADCFILLLDAARLANIPMQTIFEEMKKKFEKNKSRRWGKPDENGVSEHIKEE